MSRPILHLKEPYRIVGDSKTGMIALEFYNGAIWVESRQFEAREMSAALKEVERRLDLGVSLRLSFIHNQAVFTENVY